MTNTRSTGLTVIHIHRDIDIDLEAALDKFATLQYKGRGHKLTAPPKAIPRTAPGLSVKTLPCIIHTQKLIR